jgi:hypothetical protein
MYSWANKTREYATFLKGGYFEVPNSTAIIVLSSRELTAEQIATNATLSAEKATETGNSLTMFIIFFASVDIGFRIFDYSSNEKKNQPCKQELEEP